MTIRNAVYGYIVGNLIGVPYVGLRRGEFTVPDDPKLSKTWSEDVALTLATADAIKASHGQINLKAMMENYGRYIYDGAYTVDGQTSRVGNTLSRAVQSYRLGLPIHKCGAILNHENGSGALKRILPLAYADNLSDRDIENVISITHAQLLNRIVGLSYVRYMENVPFASHFEVSRVCEIPEVNVKSNGFVINAFESAMWAFETTDTFRDCILRAVRLGYDTDTVTALAGGMAGAEYGIEGIPPEWLSCVPNVELIERCLWD